MPRRTLTNPPTAPTARSPQRRWRACCRGELPAEALTTRDREDLVAELHARRWTDVQIATHCRMTSYTVSRIRDRIGLEPNYSEEVS